MVEEIERPKGNTDEDVLTRVRARYPEVEEYWKEDFEKAKDDQKFRNGTHWPEAIEKQRVKDGRPCMVINRTENFIDQVTGDQRQNRPQIKIIPSEDGSDPIVAEIMTGLIRNIEYQSTADTAYDGAFDQGVGNGFGWFQFETKYCDPKSFNQEIGIKQIENCFSVLKDPLGRYCYVIERMSKEEFSINYPDASMVAFDKGQKWRGSTNWLSGDTIMLADYWERRPITRTLLLLDNEKTVYKDEISDEYMAKHSLKILKERKSESFEVWWHKTNGFEILESKPWPGTIIPVVGVMGKCLNLDGKNIHRSLIRWAKDPLRMLDYARSSAAETLALAPKIPYVAEEGQIEGHEQEWADANKSNSSVLVYKRVEGVPNAPQRQEPATMNTAAFTEAKASEEDLEAVMGIYKAGLGAPSNERSGIAQKERKRESDTGTFAFIDNLTRALTEAGKIFVDIIPKIYDAKRVIRIKNLDETEQFVMINGKIEGGDVKKYGIPEKTEEGAFYDLKVGKYDVQVTTGPSHATQRREASEGMIDFVEAVPDTGPVIMDLIADVQDWPGKEKLVKRLKKMLPPEMRDKEEGEEEEQEQEPPPPPTPAEQIEMQKLEIEAEKLRVEMEKLDVDRMKIAADATKAAQDGDERIAEIATDIANKALQDFTEGKASLSQ